MKNLKHVLSGMILSIRRSTLYKVFFVVTGIASTVWFLIRVIPKPQRAAYPCMRASAPVMSAFVLYLLSLAGTAAAFRKARMNFSRYRVLTGILFLVVALAGTLFILNRETGFASGSKAEWIITPNHPVGTAKGIFPGRVVWVHDPAVATWDGKSGHWWDDQVVSQQETDKMVKDALISLTGEKSEKKAWPALFSYFNAVRGHKDLMYRQGQKIAVKINTNNTYGHQDSPEVNATPQMVLSLLKSLVREAGVPQEAITVFDASRFITNNIFEKCHAEFPGVIFVDNIGGDGRVKSAYLDNAIPYSMDNGRLATGLATCAVQADYLINMALLKGHVGQGVTLCAKNWYGTTSIYNDWRKNAHDNFNQDREGKPRYLTFVDFMAHGDLGRKTMLYLIDGIYGTKLVNGEPGPKWKMKPFNNNWTCSLLASQDPVAIDAVGIDFLRSEFPDAPDMAFSDSYLFEAAQADNPPSGTKYDPQRKGEKVPSLGTMEHWNNGEEKKYSRNLGKKEGIELVSVSAQQPDPGFREAAGNGTLVNEGFNRCIQFVDAWMKHADPVTGLIPRNLTDSKDYWNAWDAAADNYPFMVLTSSILMPDFFSGTALNMLKTEKKLTSRIGNLPDTWSFSKKGFRNDVIDTSQIIFGSAEYMKDGLIPLTEWLGKSPWSDRMLEILNDLPRLVRVVKQVRGDWFGKSAVVEVNGDLLQVLSRMYWFTGKREYLEWAAEIADWYLNDERLPTIGLDRLRIRDHGCEIISGLCEVYLAASYAMPEKRQQWKKYIHLMLDRILEVGRNSDGLFYDEVNPQNGQVVSSHLSDTFGYTLNAYYFVYQIDGTENYRDAVIKALSSLNARYRGHDWEGGSQDGYADAIEGVLNLYNREPVPSAAEWLDSETRRLWSFQKPDGMIEGWHGDGNFARTTIMYCLWKTQGIVPKPWKSDLMVGAVTENGQLKIAVSCQSGWEGKLVFDSPRYRDNMHFPFDYPRINQFQQWFTIETEKMYTLQYGKNGKAKSFRGNELIQGLPVSVRQGEVVYLTVLKSFSQ